jgi:hypothetical protein
MPALGPYAAVDPPAIIAVTAAVRSHRVDHGLASFLVSFIHVRHRSARTTSNRQPTSRTVLT